MKAAQYFVQRIGVKKLAILLLLAVSAFADAVATADAALASCGQFQPQGPMVWKEKKLSEAKPSSQAQSQNSVGLSFDLLGSLQASYSSRRILSIYSLETPQGRVLSKGQYTREGSNEVVRVFDCSGQLVGVWREIFTGDSLRWNVIITLEDAEGRVIAKSDEHHHLAGRFLMVDESSGLPWLRVEDGLTSSPRFEVITPSQIDGLLVPFSLMFRSQPKNAHL